MARVRERTPLRGRALGTFGALLLAGIACSGNELARTFALNQAEATPAPGTPSATLPERASSVTPSSVTAEPTPAPAPEVPSSPPQVAASEREPSQPDGVSAPDATPAPDASAAAPVAEPPELVATARETVVYAEPTRSSKKLGYLRLGARIRRAPRAAGHDGCTLGWYRIAPEGFVCVGPAATLDENHVLAELARTRPDRDAALPYVYGRSKPVPPPLYAHLPSHTETIALEGGAARSAAGFDDLTPRPELPFLADGAALPLPLGFERPATPGTPRALPNSGFALLDVLEHEGRRFGITTDLELVPLDRLTRVEPSAFHGVVLDEQTTLPLVFVRARHAVLFAGSPERGFRPARPLCYREAVSLGERTVTLDGVRYLETRSGEWLRDAELVRVDAVAKPPAGVRGDRTWIHVSVLDQTLVAYAGSRPVYATLVSTGKDGMGDPETTHSTPRGEFMIHTKHVSATMSGDEIGDEFDLRDVPYVEYFTQGFAFHAAYWHDAFGAPHSHGCVNLSPLDARFLFHFTEPAVPQGWHGAFSREGTLVSITP
ncbi:MAG TPA: L,D-transpeptidase family protein [Polyangiaceae bacterium]|nr:L,D-transpeptidase family protein [Polyangiaceae bacterium]